MLDYILLYNGFMNNLKETNIRKAILHIRRHLNELLNSQLELLSQEKDSEESSHYLCNSLLLNV